MSCVHVCFFCKMFGTYCIKNVRVLMCGPTTETFVDAAMCSTMNIFHSCKYLMQDQLMIPVHFPQITFPV